MASVNTGRTTRVVHARRCSACVRYPIPEGPRRAPLLRAAWRQLEMADLRFQRYKAVIRRLAQSVALRFGFQYGILPLLCLSPGAISHPASCSLSLPAPIVARSSLIVTASAATSLRSYGNLGGRRAFCWSAGF